MTQYHMSECCSTASPLNIPTLDRRARRSSFGLVFALSRGDASDDDLDHTHVASNVVVAVVVVVVVVVVAVVDTCVRGRRRNTRACLKMSERHSIHRS